MVYSRERINELTAVVNMLHMAVQKPGNVRAKANVDYLIPAESPNESRRRSDRVQVDQDQAIRDLLAGLRTEIKGCTQAVQHQTRELSTTNKALGDLGERVTKIEDVQNEHSTKVE